VHCLGDTGRLAKKETCCLRKIPSHTTQHSSFEYLKALLLKHAATLRVIAVQCMPCQRPRSHTIS